MKSLRKCRPHWHICCAVLFLVNTYFVTEAAEPLTEILVTGELLEDNLLELPNSVSVIDADVIEQRSAQHLEELLNLAPNVNFASGASRGRFVQIRGIGERSEFQEPIINSVGVVIDGIDMTGLATAASTLDIKQVEVFRGPQGTLFGANALAGLINLVSNRPTDEFYGRLNTAVEEFGGLDLGAVISGPISDNSGYRFAVKHYQSDGFGDNIFVGRDDTNNIDETTARATFASQVNENLDLDFVLFLADIDNGYDAFSLDNTRQSYSDQPGYDRQDTTAGAVKANYQINERLTFEGLISVADSDTEYAYDEDWSNLSICENTACDSDLFGFDWFYSSFDDYQRNNNNLSLDLKLLSTGNENSNWVLGLYHRAQEIKLSRIYTFAGSDFNSALETKNTAIYGQFSQQLSSNISLTSGLRLEQRDIDYTDNTGASANPEEDLWGGRIAMEYLSGNGAFYYGLISRGYKPGGFNLDASIPTAQRKFDTETMINYELGFKQSFLDGDLRVQAALFYQDRNAIQSKQSIVASIDSGELGGNCPCSFTDFTDNAASGSNKGIELEIDWAANQRLNLFASLGLLDTQFDNFLSFDHVSADRDNGVAFNLDGREQAHAPSYQWVIGGEYSLAEQWTISGSVEAKDDFFFSDRHQERSDAYEIINMQLAYNADSWRIALYAKNLSDELVETRGFGSFGNDPRNFYETQAYNQFGAPRVIGLKASVEF